MIRCLLVLAVACTLGCFAEEESIEVVLLANETKIEAVTVFSDRAEVTRTATFTAECAGTYKLTIRGLSNKIDSNSVRAQTDSDAVIQHLSFDEIKDIGEEPQEVAKIRANLTALKAETPAFSSELARLDRERELLNRYADSSVKPTGKEGALADLGSVESMLDFYVKRLRAIDERRAAVAVLQQRNSAQQREAMGRQRQLLGEWRSNHTKRGYEASVALRVKQGGGEATVRLVYVVHDAWWTPSYDVHVSSRGGGSRSMALTYFGKVWQRSHEDWSGCHLSLSTATPGVGGVPPTLHPLVASLETAAQRHRRLASSSSFGGNSGGNMYRSGGYQKKAKSQQKHSKMYQQQQYQTVTVEGTTSSPTSIAAAAGGATFTLTAAPDAAAVTGSLSAIYGGSGAAPTAMGESEEEAELLAGDSSSDAASSRGGGGGVATARVQRFSSSASFDIPHAASVASDGQPKKLTIAVLDLPVTLTHTAVPALTGNAFLRARSRNTGDYPLLPSDSVQVFFDGALVARTRLRGVSPGEAFRLYLEVDPEVKVSTTGGDAVRRQHGFVSKSQSDTTRRVLSVSNHKAAEAVRVKLLHRMPVTTNENIAVTLLSPSPDSPLVTTLESGQAAAAFDEERGGGDDAKGGSDAAAAGKTGVRSVVVDKDSHLIRWWVVVAPGEKLDIPFEFSVEWPQDQHLLLEERKKR